MYAKKKEKEIMTIYLQNQENLSFLLEKWAKCVVARVWCVTTSKMFARTHFAHMLKVFSHAHAHVRPHIAHVRVRTHLRNPSFELLTQSIVYAIV